MVSTATGDGHSSEKAEPRLSVVVPVGPGERAWEGLVDSLYGLPKTTQIILSACEAPPRTGLPRGWRWIESPPGRAAQLNRGANEARGELLWFLHADCRPDAEVLAFVRETIGSPPCGLSYFDLAFASDGPGMTVLNAIGGNFRSRWLGMPFGDQGWLMSKSVFARVGGFDSEFGLGEDLEFVVRARRLGVRLQRIPISLRTSARRYRDRGWLIVTLRHLLLTLELSCRARQNR